MTLTDHSWSHPVHHHASSSSTSSGASGSSNTTSPMMMMESSSLDSHCSSPGQTSLTMDNCSMMDHHHTNSHHSFVHHHHLLSSTRPNGDVSYPSSSSTDSSCYFSSSEFGMIGFLERKPYRPFRSNQEYLIAMKEDLAEWLNTMYGLHLTCENFLQQLETGVILCQHANSVLRKVNEWRLMNVTNCIDGGGGAPASIVTAANAILERRELVPIKLNAAPGTFQARDNIANFIDWCKRIQIHECLLFETEDLVGRKNEKSFILCLLEVARYGAKFGVLAPTLVQFEQEIDQEIEIDNQKAKQANLVDYDNCSAFENGKQNGFHSNDVDNDDEPKQQITNNDLESLHEKVVNLLSRCTCPVQFYLEHLSEGKYRIGDTRTLIFVRILRNHVMVRVGGGWDTLEHYLEKHDPCRCRFGHRYTNTARVVVPPANGNKSAISSLGQPLTMQVTMDRPAPGKLPNSVSCSSPISPPWRKLSGKHPPPLQQTPAPGHAVSYNGHANHSRRASTSSNDSQNTSSSCSVPDSISSGTSNASSLPLPSIGSIIVPELDNYNRQSLAQPKKQNSRQLLANTTTQSANFTVLPDRNNNIKGLSTNGQRQSTSSKSHYLQPNKANIANGNVNQVAQINGHKRRPSLAETAENYTSSSPSPYSTVSSSSSSSSLVTVSRIPKSRSAIVNALVATPGNGNNHNQQSRFTNNKSLLSSAYKAKSTSVCSLAAAVVSGNSSINGNGSSKIPSLSNVDRKKLLNHYGLPLGHGYSSHSIYLDCNSRQSISTGNGQQNLVQKTSTTYNKSSPPVASKIKYKSRYDKQKLNKSTIDLISSGLMNENGASTTKQRPNVSNGNSGPRSMNTSMINDTGRNMNSSSMSLINISNISRTKSTTNMANNVSNSNNNNKQTVLGKQKRQTGSNPIGRRLQKGKSLGGSATSLNSSNDCPSSSSSSSSSTISATNSSNDSLDNDHQTGESVPLNRRITKSTVYNNNRQRRLSGLTGTGASAGQTPNCNFAKTSSSCSMSSSTSTSMLSKHSDAAVDQNQSASQRQMMVWLKNKQQQQPLEHQIPAAKVNEARPVPTTRTITGFCHDDGNNNIDNNNDNKGTMTAATANPTSTIFTSNTNHNFNPDPIIYQAHNNSSNDNNDNNHNIGNITHHKDNGTKQSSPGALVEVCSWLERSHLHRTAANAASP